MENSINSDLIRGHINTIILKALYEGDRYGYDIIKDIEQKSSGQYQLKQPTLYSCLKRLETQGFISSYWGAKSNGGRRKYYALTDMGRELFIQNQTEWEYSRTVIDKLISDKQFDLSAVTPADLQEQTAAESAQTAIAVEEEPDESEEERDESEKDAASETETDPIPERDTGEYLRRLFGEKLNETQASYSEKLFNERVEPGVQLKADNFFKDFTDETEEEAPPPVTPEPPRPAYPPPPERAESFEPFPEAAEAIGVQEVNEREETPFLRYDTPVENAPTEQETTIRREYKNILSELLTPPAQKPVAEIERIADPLPPPEPPKAEIRTEEKFQAGKFEKLAAGVKDLGDGIKIRTHNSAAAKAYNAENYYYANKLMLHHYAILFGLCLFEIIVMFLAMSVGFGIKQQNAAGLRVDLAVYGAAVGGALVFPIVAAVLNFIDPYRKKRADFNLKSSLIFRFSLTLILLVLTYLINLCCGMKVTSAEGYIPSLVVPMVMSVNFIFSTLIFNLLYTSKKFAAE